MSWLIHHASGISYADCYDEAVEAAQAIANSSKRTVSVYYHELDVSPEDDPEEGDFRPQHEINGVRPSIDFPITL